MVKPALQVVLTAVVLLGVLFAASAQAREARVDAVEVFADATGVSIIVSGALPNGCTELGEPTQTVQRNRINISLPTTRQSGVFCTDAIVLFEETIPLDVSGLTPGEYTVDVNGITTQFTLTQDMLGAQPQPGTPQPTEEAQPPTAAPVSAFVDQVEIRLDENNGANLLVSGNLPDGCTELVGYTQVNDAEVITVNLLTTRPPDAACTTALEPFEQTLPLDVAGLAEGAYSVTVNGVTAPPFVLNGATEPAESDCVILSGEFGFIRNLADGYCIGFPNDYAVDTPQPGLLTMTSPEGQANPTLTINVEPAEGRTLEAIASESDLPLEEGAISGEPALVSGALSDSSGSWQAWVLYDDLLYTIIVKVQDATQTPEMWQTIIDGFTFLSP